MGLFGWLKGGAGREETGKARPIAAPSPGPRGAELIAAGRFAEACEAFRKAVAAEPRVAAHRVNLAFALQEAGEAALAIDHLKAATSLDSASFDAHYMLGGALEQAGSMADSALALHRAVELNPSMEQAQADLVRVLAKDGRNDEATAVADAALLSFPESANLCVARGNLHMAASETEAALASFDRALAIQPGDTNVRLNRSLALQAAGRFDEALAEFDLILAAEPVSVQAHAGRGRVLRAKGDLAGAIVAYRRGHEIDPADAELLNLLGSALHRHGEMKAAIECYREAIRLQPRLPGGYVNLGMALTDLGQVGAAIAELNKGLEVEPLAETHDNLAIALQKAGVLDGAIHHFREALKLRPDNLDTLCNLAGALCDAGELAQSNAEYRTILELDERNFFAHSNLLFNLSAFGAASSTEYLEEARRFDAKVTPVPAPIVTPRPRAPGDPLRIGFVSGDLRSHPVGFFLEGVLANLDRQRFELYGYPTIVFEDALTARIRPLFARWKLLRGLSDEQGVAAIRSDELDVLFDLGGHTGENRMQIFAARAAPVQISWLGYFASTGVSSMDYILADDVCVPVGMEHQFTEKVWRLPQTRLCMTPLDPGTAPPVAALPALQRGHVTFGSFQRLAKINADVLGVWGRVFERLPTARLFLQAPQTGRQVYVDEILERLKKVGIEPDRVTIRPPLARAQYLQAHGEVDIILDTFPFNGGTTTCEALWMGVPTLTLEGDTMISRQGMTMMTAVGLADWVAADRQEYVDLAVARAGDLVSLTGLRGSLRERARHSALFDVGLFARRFSQAIEAIWEKEAGIRQA